ncbi:DUF1036 domain-containing protein [Streptomyces sp. NBC_00237]|uniref:DUF1036 domain-containing protein n=1 Tax=Streptomyces sp. NBC_00237 TaxID=2975687 RepID=UPI0022572528|nr:DUF1036 domain-containing protein [Streptomyces sp. NBC_00237]MCX5206857.1 DUF1036 domain-containing protein [Streptomyces sp. NBC_00237]
MGLTIRNQYSARVYVAIGFSDNSCPHGTGPHLMGWWGIDPGGSALVYANDVNEYSPQWLYYAETAGGGVFWAGTYAVPLPNAAFNMCRWPERPGQRRGFRSLHVGQDNEDFTLTLTR